MKKITQNKFYIIMTFVFLIVLGMSFNNISKATYQKNNLNSGVVSHSNSLKLSSSTECNVRNGRYRLFTLPEAFYDCVISVDDETIATVELDSSTNTIKVTGKKIGDTNFTLTNSNGQTLTATAHIYTCSSIVPSKTTYTVYLGTTTEKVGFTVYPANGNCRVTYDYPKDFDECFSFNSDKTIIPKKAGNYYFYLYAEDEEQPMCKCNLIIKAPYFSKTSYNVYKNKSVATSLNGKNANTTYTSSNNAIATVDQNGNVKGLKAGTVTITANTNGYKSATKVVVSNPTLSQKAVSLYQKKTTILKVNGGTGAVKWSSSNPQIAKVASNGKVTALKPGTAYISANVNGDVAKCKITVKAPALSVKSKTIIAKQTYALKVNGATGKVKWKSSNSKVVKVASNGKITGIKAGSATITATVNGKQLKCKVTVKANQKTYKVNKNAASYNYGKPVCRLSKIAYSGNDIIADVWVMNNRMFYAKKFTSINIAVYDSKGKVVANKTFKNINLKLGAYKSKKLTFKFTGKSVKNKKAILNNGVDCYYTYYYIYNV